MLEELLVFAVLTGSVIAAAMLIELYLTAKELFIEWIIHFSASASSR